jgi:hypothetical protein
MAIISGALMLFKLRNLGSVLAKNWKLVIIVVLVAGIGYYHWDRTRTIEGLREDVRVLEQNFANCQGAITRQNSIIDTAATAAKEVLEKERNDTAIAVANEKAKTQAAIDKLTNKEVAQTCEAAVIDMINEAHGDLKWDE